MNKRILLILGGLALPVVLLAVIIGSGSPTPPAARPPAPAMAPHPFTLEQTRAQVRNRLAQLEKMKPEDWPAELRVHPHAAPTLQQALEGNRRRLADLERMTPEQWNAQHQAAMQRQSSPAPRPLPTTQPAAPAPAR